MARRADLLLLILLAGCPDAPSAPRATAPVTPPREPAPAGVIPQRLPRLPDEGPVYGVPGWPSHAPPLAPGDGRAALQAHCSACHATTYVTMQPPLPAASWQAVVDKMIKTYGAQVGDDAAKEVLTYLAAHYTPETVEATYAAVAASAPADARDVGARVYRATCAPCHQPEGQGLAGAFPPLVGHVPALVTERRSHLVRLLLYGQQGPIEAGGQRFDAAMPGFGQLTDEEVAGVLSYVARSWGNDARLPAGWTPYAPAEVAAERGKALAPRDVHRQR